MHSIVQKKNHLAKNLRNKLKDFVFNTFWNITIILIILSGFFYKTHLEQNKAVKSNL